MSELTLRQPARPGKVVASDGRDVAAPAMKRVFHIEVGFRNAYRRLDMSISRREALRILSLASAGLATTVNAHESLFDQARVVLGCRLHDDVSLSLLLTYARSLALGDADARWQAQMMFHEAQLARDGGGTMGHKLGYRHKAFLEANERKPG